MIEFDHVSMAYQLSENLALKNVSFKIERGEFVFIIGSSGSGKSTIIKLLTCEERPLKGEIIVNGFSLNTIKKKQIPYLRRNIGMVFQDFRLIPSKTVFENVSYAMEIVGASKRAILHQVPMVLSIVGLRNRQSAYPHELSGGEQQRVAIARAMVNKPMMILADEPTGNLDPANSESIMALLAEINKSGTTVLVCSHDKDLVTRMKRRVISINEGVKIRDDNASGFYATDNDVLMQAVSVNQPFTATEDEETELDSAMSTPELGEQETVETFTVAQTPASDKSATSNKQTIELNQSATTHKLNVSRVNLEQMTEPADTLVDRTQEENKQANGVDAKVGRSWTKSIHSALYHENEDDYEANEPVLPQQETSLLEQETAIKNNQHSSLSSERIERWGKRRF